MAKRTLLVDDNQEVLTTLEAFFNATGFQVTAFESADTAMNELSEDELKEFEFIVTDFEMPGTKGDEFAVQMHLLNPESVIFIISAAIKSVSVEAARIATLVEKPFSLASLVRKMVPRKPFYPRPRYANSIAVR